MTISFAFLPELSVTIASYRFPSVQPHLQHFISPVEARLILKKAHPHICAQTLQGSHLMQRKSQRPPAGSNPGLSGLPLPPLLPLLVLPPRCF